ncbi:hypothetical protein ACQQ2N_19500 [Dokdonella sp. MW10]|uniref:hypothetical protein n=1 Tax=Dokdonella sp. MW10 TaxID=2992926 RepID=UPI003F7D91BA
MSQALVLNLLLLLGGFYFGIRNVILLRSEEALRDYMKRSHKAVAWVDKYGIDRATSMARESLIPLGLVMAAAMTGVGGWNLWRIFA